MKCSLSVGTLAVIALSADLLLAQQPGPSTGQTPVDQRTNLQLTASYDDQPAPSSEPAHEEEEVNNGQDFTRPIRRFDLRYQYQQPQDGLEESIFTLRMDWPVQLSADWKFNMRFDMPLIYGDVPSRDNPNGDYEFGSGSFLAQGLFIHPLNDEVALAGGLQAIFPTDSHDQFGSGSLRLLPSVAVRYAPKSFPKGWWMALLTRYDVDVWKHHGRESTSDLIIEPVFNVALPDRWFATFAPEMKYSFIEDDWFIPFDVTVGKMITKRIVASVEYKHELYNEYAQYDWAVEFRIGFFF